MKSLASYLIAMFAGLFWLFRFVVILMDTMAIQFVIEPVNSATEIMLLFITIICIVLIVKRKMAGGIIYLLTHFVYFGYDTYLRVMTVINGENDVNTTLAAIISLIGIILPIMVFVDLLLDHSRKTTGGDKKTDWFYKNNDFDRQLDERADKNQYKF